jgi:hypothetical protein
VPKWLDEVFRHSYARLDKRYPTSADFFAAMSVSSPPPLPRQPASAAAMAAAGFAAPPPLPMGQPQQQGRTTCPHCRQSISAEDNFCMHCGVQLVSHVRRCNKCGAYPDPRDRYCILCGDELSLPVTT